MVRMGGVPSPLFCPSLVFKNTALLHCPFQPMSFPSPCSHSPRPPPICVIARYNVCLVMHVLTFPRGGRNPPDWTALPPPPPSLPSPPNARDTSHALLSHLYLKRTAGAREDVRTDLATLSHMHEDPPPLHLFNSLTPPYLLPSPSTHTGDIQYNQLPDSSTPQDPLGLRDDPSLNFGDTYGAAGSRLTKGCNVKNAENGHLYGCGMALETPLGINVGIGADVMKDGSVKFGIGGGQGGKEGGVGFGAGCEVGADGSLRCGKASTLGGQQGFASAGDATTHAVAAEAGMIAQLAGLQGGMEGGGVQVDGEYKEGTLHLNVDSHDFHEVITGGTVYVPPDLAAQQEAFYVRKAEGAGSPKEAGVKPVAAGEPVAAVAPVPAAAAVPAAAEVATVEEGDDVLPVPKKKKPVVKKPVEKPAAAAAPAPPATTIVGVAAAAGDALLPQAGAKPSPLQAPAAPAVSKGPEFPGAPVMHKFGGKLPVTNDEVVGTMLLPPALGAQMWRIAGSHVVVNCSNALLTYDGNPYPISFEDSGVERVTQLVSGIKEEDEALLDILYFYNVTLTLGEPEFLPTPLPERVVHIMFTGEETVGESIVAETKDEAFAATYPGAGEKFAFDTMFIIYGVLDDLTPIKQMQYVHLDLTNAMPVMNMVPSPKLVMHNVGMVIRRLPPFEEEIAADTKFLNPVPEPKEEEEAAAEEEEEEEEEVVAVGGEVAVKKPPVLPVDETTGIPDADPKAAAAADAAAAAAVEEEEAAGGVTKAPPRAQGALPAGAAVAADAAVAGNKRGLRRGV